MELLESIKRRRSIRRFKQEPVPESLLKDLVSVAVVAPSGGNAQPLRYVIVHTPEMVKGVFELTAWAAHVRPKRNPVWGVSAPTAFIAVCVASGVENNPLLFADAGASIQNMLLRAVDLGLGACWLGAFDKGKVADALLLEDLGCVYLVAVGYPDESPEMQTIKVGQPTKYNVDANDVLHVPKYDQESVTIVK